MSTNVASVTSHFPDAENGFTTTTAGSVGSGATTVTLNSVGGYTNGMPVVLVIDPTDVTKKQTFTGIVDTGGVQITNVVWTAGTNTTHALGATVVDYATATHIAMISKGILTHADQDGTLKADSVDVTAVIKDGIVTDDKMATAVKPVTRTSEMFFDHVASGCVWTADAAGSTKAASCSSGVVYLSGVRLTVVAVVARVFTASKDVYCDLHNNGDGTAVWVYADNTTNAASPALTAGNLRGGIVVVGASSIAAAASINQGEENKVLPIASSIPYAVTDSLGNLICPRDPNRKILGYRQSLVDLTGTTASDVFVAPLGVPVIVPTGRKVKVTAYGGIFRSSTTNSPTLTIYSGATPGTLSTLLQSLYGLNSATLFIGTGCEWMGTPASASIAFSVALNSGGASTATLRALQICFIKVELV